VQTGFRVLSSLRDFQFFYRNFLCFKHLQLFKLFKLLITAIFALSGLVGHVARGLSVADGSPCLEGGLKRGRALLTKVPHLR
jgi:hypothetical protein